MELDWTDEERALIKETERFSREALSPRASNKGFDRPAWEASAKFGMLKTPLPVPWGGKGAGALRTVALFEALGRGGADRGLMFAMGAHLFGCAVPISLYEAPVHHERWGQGLAEGSVIAALAATEAGGGSTLDSMKTRAEKRNHGYILSGRKTLVTNAPHANLFLVLALEAPEPGPFGLTAFLAPRQTKGLSVKRLSPTFGLTGAPMGEVSFDGCVLPEEAVLGRPKAGLQVFLRSMRWERSCLLAGFVGAAERDLATCVRHLKSRRNRRGSLFENQAVAHRIARMKARLETARWLVYRAAWDIDRDNDSLLGPSIAKLVASEAVAENAMDALRLLAGAGWLDHGGMASALRDVVGTLSASGTSEIQLNIIAESLGL